MDTVVRNRRDVLIALVIVPMLGAFAACGGRPPAEPVGTSDRPAGGSTAPKDTRDAGVHPGSVALPAEYKTAFVKLNKSRFVSQGHASGRWDVDVFANEAARKAIAARARDVPVGAVVVAEHYEKSPQTTSNVGPIMMMEKRAKGFAPEHGDWRYAVVGSGGQLVRDGTIDSCAGCHDDAPMDGLFPLAD